MGAVGAVIMDDVLLLGAGSCSLEALRIPENPPVCRPQAPIVLRLERYLLRNGT